MRERRMPLTAWELSVCWLGGAIAWLVHLLGAYALAEFGCVAGWARVSAGGVTLVAWAVLALTAATAITAAWAAVVSRAADMRLSGVTDPTRTRHFAARAGMWLNGLFLGIILTEALPVWFYLGRCG